MSRIDIDRARASYAFKVVKEGRGNKAYGSQVEKLPMMIHNSGLRNTLAFAYAKGYLNGKDGGNEKGKEWRQVFTHLVNWFATEDPTKFFDAKFDPMPDDCLKVHESTAEKNLEFIVKLKDDSQYRFATQEIFALVNWMRKLVKGEEVSNA